MNSDTQTSLERSRSADPAPSSDSDGVDTRLFYQQSFALLPAIKSSVFQRKRNDNESRYDEFKELKRSDKFTLNCWNSFCKFARPVSPTRDAEKREGESELNIAKLPQAVKLVHSDVRLEDVQKLASELLWSENEMISWEKFKYFCWELFHKVLQFREHEVHIDEGTLEQSQQSFDVLSRRQKYITSTGLDCLGGSSSQSQLSRVAGTSISSIQKDGVVEVIRRELRENAREGKHLVYGEKIPRYAAPIEKNLVAGMLNPSERVHAKWRKTLSKKKERDKQLKGRRQKLELVKVISASVQACDRMVTNAALKAQDASHFDALYANWERRREEEMNTQSNIERWRQETYLQRHESVRLLKEARSFSSSLLSENKLLMRTQLRDDASINSGSSFASGRKYESLGTNSGVLTKSVRLSPETSTMIEPPAELTEIMKNAKTAKEYHWAKNKIKEHVDNSLSERIKNYANQRMIQKSLAGLDGEVSITNLDGNDYFSQKRGPAKSKMKKGFISGQNSLTDSI